MYQLKFGVNPEDYGFIPNKDMKGFVDFYREVPASKGKRANKWRLFLHRGILYWYKRSGETWLEETGRVDSTDVPGVKEVLALGIFEEVKYS